MTRPLPRVLALSLLFTVLADLSSSAVGQDKASAKALPELNRKVLEFAKAHKGKQVGDGECWTLAKEALMAAGAQPPGGASQTVFGRKLARKEAILAGDVVQFEKAKTVYPDGRWYSFPHHTAIVYSAKGTQLKLIHQNVNGKRFVQVTTEDLAAITEGTVDIYRPQPAQPIGK